MPELSNTEVALVAKAIATIAHRGQTDKAEQPYIGHPARVAASIAISRDHSLTTAVAWLHDVLEDTDITRDDLHAAGIPWPVIVDVERLTRKPDQDPEDYYRSITGSPRALEVKLADIADNTNPDRLALLDDQTIARLIHKYATARRLLGVAP